MRTIRLRRKHKPCARCRHFFEVHGLELGTAGGPCNARPKVSVLRPSSGGPMLYVESCACPAYVAPAPLWLQVLNAVWSKR